MSLLWQLRQNDPHADAAAADFLTDYLLSDPEAWDRARPEAAALWRRVVAA